MNKNFNNNNGTNNNSNNNEFDFGGIVMIIMYQRISKHQQNLASQEELKEKYKLSEK